MKELYRVNFFQNENKRPKSLILITLAVICVLLTLTLYYLIEIKGNYKGWTSYLKLIQPILMIFLIYIQSTGKWIFKRNFVMTDEEVSWKLRTLITPVKLSWNDIKEIRIDKNFLQFLLTNRKVERIELSNFTYDQIQSLKAVTNKVGMTKNIEINIT